MKYDFKCQNEECFEFGITVEKEMSINDYKTPKCEYCGKTMERVYSSYSIKTSDGFKR